MKSINWAVPLASRVMVGNRAPMVPTGHPYTRGCLSPQRTHQYANVVDEQ